LTTPDIFDTIKEMDEKWDSRLKPFSKNVWKKEIDLKYYGNQTALEVGLIDIMGRMDF